MSKPGRPRKIERTCFKCRDAVSPKNGDWHLSPQTQGQQIFLCHGCCLAGEARYSKVNVWS